MEDFFARIPKEGGGTQTATIEQVRFIAPDLAIVDGSGRLQARGMPMADHYLLSRDAGLKLCRKSIAVGALSQRARW